MQWLAFHLPTRPMFVLTSAFLFPMGPRMVGEAFRELQEQQILSYTTNGVAAFVSEQGLNDATWEVIGVQAALLPVALVVGISMLRRRKTDAPGPAASREASGRVVRGDADHRQRHFHGAVALEGREGGRPQDEGEAEDEKRSLDAAVELFHRTLPARGSESYPRPAQHRARWYPNRQAPAVAPSGQSLEAIALVSPLTPARPAPSRRGRRRRAGA
jgi:hypothetical protein